MAIYKLTDKSKFPKKYKNEKELYYYRCYYTDLHGKRKQRKSKLFNRKKDAEDDERYFFNSMKDLSFKKNITLEELMIDYLEYKKDKVRDSTIDTIKSSYKYFEDIKDIVVEDMTLKQFENWKKTINEYSFQTGYKNTIYKRFRALLNYGVKFHDMKINIINKITNFTNPNEIKKEMLFYTLDEFKQFISYEKELKWICFFSTLFYAGLREGEALALNWNNINFDKNTISITKSISTRKKGINYVILPPKTKGSIRTLPIPKNLSNSLKMLYNEVIKYSNFKKEWFVFNDTLPLPTTTIQKRRDKLVELSGVKRIRIHDFRHSYASLLISKGANIVLLSKLLGHDDVSTTLNTYSHFYENDLSNLIFNIDNDDIANNESKTINEDFIDLINNYLHYLLMTETSKDEIIRKLKIYEKTLVNV